MKMRPQDWILIWGGVIATSLWGSGWRDWLILAGVILLYLTVRTLLPKQTNLFPQAANEEDNSFLVTYCKQPDTFEKEVLELDVDLSYCRAPNHFRVHRQFDIYVSDWEYEYNVSPTGVFARLLQFRSEGAGEPEEWMVRDGVVQEADIRAAWELKKYHWDDIEDKMTDLKLQTEWCPIPPLYWEGASYFILSKKLPQPDARRYFRQELERLRRGVDLSTKELTKLNYKKTDDGKFVILGERALAASEEQWAAFREAVPTYGITIAEFQKSSVLETRLKKLLAD